MQLEITRKFQKQVVKCKDKRIKKNISILIKTTLNATALSEIKNLKKLKGYKIMYRVRIGDYRVGIAVKNKTIIFASFDHRADIYKYFP